MSSLLAEAQSILEARPSDPTLRVLVLMLEQLGRIEQLLSPTVVITCSGDAAQVAAKLQQPRDMPKSPAGSAKMVSEPGRLPRVSNASADAAAGSAGEPRSRRVRR